MAKDKLSVNPAERQRKLEKAKALKKGKLEKDKRRTEKLARRNPERIERQISELESLREAGRLRPHEAKVLEELQRDLKGVRKARETLGTETQGRSFPSSSRGNGDRGGRGGRGGVGRGGRPRDRQEGDESETDEEVRRIPMPRDTPPPIPPEFLPQLPQRQGPHALPPKPVAEPVKVVYEAAPAIRDLRKEVTSRFVPDSVARKIRLAKQAQGGGGRLLEEEEVEGLEREGYAGRMDVEEKVEKTSGFVIDAAPVVDETRALEEEEERFSREMRQVEMEEVEDEDG